MRTHKFYPRLALAVSAALFSCVASAVTYTDNFSGNASKLDWRALDYACLTAINQSGNKGTIPTCAGAKDQVGFGALRLTPAVDYKTGAILSNFTFPNNQGLQVTFTTYTYGGDKGGVAANGADGITFILTDGTEPLPDNATTGASGGAMGYSCSNTNRTDDENGKSEGMANAYLGLGIDEYGNFLNKGDNTNTGIYNSRYSKGTTDHGDNKFQTELSGPVAGGKGPYYQPERIGLRGAGNLTWKWLKGENPDYYSGDASASANQTKINTACRKGKYVASGTDGDSNLKPIEYNYNVIDVIEGGYRVLPDNNLIANEEAKKRTDATPIQYKLQISTSGLLNFSYSYNNGAFQQVLINNSITDSNGPLPDSFRFGFSAGTGGSNNVHEITCFQAAPLQSNSSASANTVQSGQVKTDTQIYLASYTADNWWGSLTSNSLTTTGGILAIASNANWDASCNLTGGLCPNMGANADTNVVPTIPAQAPDDRVLITYDTGSLGRPLQWDSLSDAQQDALNLADSRGKGVNEGPERLSWLRGSRDQEQLRPARGDLRSRAGVLGDIIDSSPTWVGAPTAGSYPDAFSDNLWDGHAAENKGSAQTYTEFASANASRMNVVYVGANDGLLHGFRAGFYSDGVYDSDSNTNDGKSTTNDGKEVLGFMPAGVLASQSTVDLTSPTYVHQYFVDATPRAGDLFYGGKWHTWLVGGVGSEGSELYLLDITDPSRFEEVNAHSLVLGDYSATSSGFDHLGNSIGTPIIERMHDGKWAVIVGNGQHSDRSSGVYVMLVDPTSGTGTRSVRFLDTGDISGGITYVTAADLDGDHITDYLYGGDLLGNVWRFDVTDKDDSKWVASKFGGSNATPLFVAKDADGKRQPITTSPSVAVVNTGGKSRVLVFVGTGNKTPLNTTSGETYAKGTQTFYGIWDWDMKWWNDHQHSTPLASLTAAQALTRSALLQQSVVSTDTGGTNAQILSYRNLSTTKVVCWKGSDACTPGTDNTQYGWYFDLPDDPTPGDNKAHPREQIIYNPTIVNGAVVVSTAIPPVINALQCNPGLQSGFTMAFNPATGGGLIPSFLPGLNGGFGPGTEGTAVGGIRMDAVGTPTTVTYGGQVYLVTQTVKSVPALSQINPPASETPNRVSWREIRN